MQKSITWFYIFLKKQCRQWETWFVNGCMVICLVFVSMIHTPSPDNCSIVFYVCDEDALSYRMKSILLSTDSIFDFYEVGSKKELLSDIQSGQAFCGFFIEEGFQDKIEKGEQKDCITYVCLRETVKGRVAKETVYAHFLELFSEQLIKINGAQYVGENFEEFLEAALDNNQLYLEKDDLFPVDYTGVQKEEMQEMDSLQIIDIYPVEGLFAAFLFLGILLVNVENQSKSRKDLLHLMGTADSIRFQVGQYMACGCIMGIIGMCCLILINQELNWKTQLFGVPGVVLISSLWAFFINKVCSNEITYHVWMVTILLFHVLINPVFFRIDTYLPILQWVQWISPVGFYLRMV